VKGPELISRYPDDARRLADLDLLAGDAERAQAALLSARFALRQGSGGPDYNLHHHLHPLVWPGTALPIELHRRVAWPRGLESPRNEELFEAAVPASVGVDGILAPDPHQHAVLLASHIWREAPMQKLRALVDVLAFTNDDDREKLAEIARGWNFERGWSATLAAADWILREGSEPGFVRYWARNLRRLREPTVFEMHLQAWLSPFTLAAPRTAVRISATAALRDLRPRPQEGWAAKARRTAHAVLHPLSARSEHDRRSGQGRWRRRSTTSAARSPERSK
jgi:hypothetical protein